MMTPVISRVRPVANADADTWLAMRMALWPNEPREELARDIRHFLTGREQLLELVLVAELGDSNLAGMAELSRRPYAEGCTTSPVGFLEGWYVAPEHRRRGIGRALVEAAKSWAQDQGCREFASDAYWENTSSAAAHRALGFEEVAIIRCFRTTLDEGRP